MVHKDSSFGPFKQNAVVGVVTNREFHAIGERRLDVKSRGGVVYVARGGLAIP
jgi:hypothetical protein